MNDPSDLNAFASRDAPANKARSWTFKPLGFCMRDEACDCLPIPSFRRRARAMSSSSSSNLDRLLPPPVVCAPEVSATLPVPPGQSRAKCPFPPHLKHPSLLELLCFKCAFECAASLPILCTKSPTLPHRSPTTSARLLPSSAARSLARFSAFNRQLAPPSPTPPDAPADKRVDAALRGGSDCLPVSLLAPAPPPSPAGGFPSPPFFQNGFSSRSLATAADRFASSSRFSWIEDFESRDVAFGSLGLG